MTDRHCPRGDRCSSRQPVFDDAGNRTGAIAGLLDHPSAGLCEPCTGKLTHILDTLPALVARLDESIGRLPTMEIRYTFDDISTSGPLHSPVPIDLHRDALLRLIDHETASHAELVADDCGVTWDSQLADVAPRTQRVHESCQLLRFRLREWLALGPREYRARSLTEHPADGHPDGVVVVDAGDAWTRRTGAEAAVLLMELYHSARRSDGGGGRPEDWLPGACRNPACGRRTLYRDPAFDTVVCRSCNDTCSSRTHEDRVRTELNALLDAADLLADEDEEVESDVAC